MGLQFPKAGLADAGQTAFNNRQHRGEAALGQLGELCLQLLQRSVIIATTAHPGQEGKDGRRQNLIDGPVGIYGLPLHGIVEGIPQCKRRQNDNRTERQTNHDQHGLGGPPRNVAQSRLDQHRIAHKKKDKIEHDQPHRNQQGKHIVIQRKHN